VTHPNPTDLDFIWLCHIPSPCAVPCRMALWVSHIETLKIVTVDCLRTCNCFLNTASIDFFMYRYVEELEIVVYNI